MPTLNSTAQESAFLQLLGLKPVDWGTDYAIFELTIAPYHLNRYDILHGGVLTAMIDTAGGFAGCYVSPSQQPRKAVTLSVTTSFTGQAREGTISVIGRKRSGGRKIFFSSAEVVDESGNVIAFGEGTYRYHSDNGEDKTATVSDNQ